MVRRSEVRDYLGITDVLESLNRIERKLRHMATQEQVDALASAIDSGVAGIRADIEALKTANPDLDLSSLEASVSRLADLDAENPPAEPGV